MAHSSQPSAVCADFYRDVPVARTGSGITYRDLSNDFTAYLSFVNAGMLNKGNLLCFDWVMRNLPSKNPIVEIGSFCGLSTNLLAYFANRHGVTNPIFNCDKWEFEGAGGNVGDSQFTHIEYRAFVQQTYLRNVNMFSRGRLPHTVEKLSDDFFTAWGDKKTVTDLFGRPARLGGPISFCYIDGNHAYAAAKSDFDNTDRFLENGGFVLFDDSADGSHWEVCRVVDQVKQRSDYQLVIANPNYLFQKIV